MIAALKIPDRISVKFNDFSDVAANDIGPMVFSRPAKDHGKAAFGTN